MINGPEDVARHLMPKLKGEIQEHFMLLALNIHHHLIGTSVVSVVACRGRWYIPVKFIDAFRGYETVRKIIVFVFSEFSAL